MSRISIPTTIDTAPAASQPMLAAVARQLEMLPNLYLLMSISPDTLCGYLGLYKTLRHGRLSAQTRNRIAVAVAKVNGSDYCLAEHAHFGRDMLNLEESEVKANRDGRVSDAKAEVAARFAARVARTGGRGVECDLDALRTAGFGDEEIVEIISQVAINAWANTLTKVFAIDIDFPTVFVHDDDGN